MALLAADAGAQWRLEGLAWLLRPSPGRFAHAARLALICALTALVCAIYRTPEPALTTYIVFFLNRRDRTSSLVLSIALLVVITIVLGFVLAVADGVVDLPPLRVFAMAVISFGLLFLTSASKLRPIGAIVALIVAYALALLGSASIGELATRGLLYAWLCVAIPAGASVLVNLLLAPSPRELLRSALAERLRLAAAMLQEPDERTRHDFARCRREGDTELQSWLKLAGAEHGTPAVELGALRAAVGASVVLLAAVDFIVRTPGVDLPAPLRISLAQALGRMASLFAAGAYPVGVELETVESPSLPSQAAAALVTLRETIVNFAEPSPAASAPSPAPKKEDGGFLRPDAFSNPDHRRYALKTTAAAMACYMLYSVLDWPGIHTCLITCYIVALSTLAESVEKLVLRIAGCLAGAGLGLAVMIFAVPALDSGWAWLSFVFAGTLAASWLAVGSPRIAYAGLQFAFAYFLCVVQGAGPAFDMTIARDRVIGIVIGNFAVYGVFTFFWPVSVGARIDAGIAAVLKLQATMLRAGDRGARRRMAGQARAALTAVEDDLAVARYEPASVRPASRWLALRQDAAAQMDALEAPLLMLTEQSPAAAAIADRIERAAVGAPGEAGAPSGAAAGPLNAVVEDHLHGLEQALHTAARGEAEPADAH